MIDDSDTKSNRGFAAMPPEQQRAIASSGGKTAHARGTAHVFTHDEASRAGKKGGTIIGQNREHMARIGRLGGLSGGRKKAAAKDGAP